MVGLFRAASTTASSASGTARRPAWTGRGDAFKHANYAGRGQERRRPRAGRRRPRVQVLDAAEPLRGRALRRAHAHDLPRQRPGDPRLRAPRLHVLARVRPLGGAEDRHQRRRRGGHGRGRSRPRRPRDSHGGARRQALPAPDQREPDPALRARYGTDAPRRAARAGAALRVGEQAQPHRRAHALGMARDSDHREDLLRRATGARRGSGSTTPRSGATASASSRWA